MEWNFDLYNLVWHDFHEVLDIICTAEMPLFRLTSQLTVLWYKIIAWYKSNLKNELFLYQVIMVHFLKTLYLQILFLYYKHLLLFIISKFKWRFIVYQFIYFAPFVFLLSYYVAYSVSVTEMNVIRTCGLVESWILCFLNLNILFVDTTCNHNLIKAQ